MLTCLILFTLSAISLWLVSLWRILSSSLGQANSSFFSNSTGAGNGRRKRNVLLVVAHPDDESMFFAPTILYLTSNGLNLYILCISNGNAEGKGNIRKEELYRACATLKVPLQQIKVVDHPDLQLISYDNYGVSGHPNHRDVHNGICIFLHENVEINIEAWELISTNIIRKYIGPVDIWISLLSSLSGQNGSICCLPNLHPLKCYQAMAEHYSQWLWFRKLFVVLSRYTYVNTLRRIIY